METVLGDHARAGAVFMRSWKIREENKDMGIADIETTLATHRDALGELGAKVKFDCGTEGVIVVDGTTRPATLSRDDAETDCTIIAPSETLRQVLAGDLNGTVAVMTGKLRLKGSTTVAMKLTSLLG